MGSQIQYSTYVKKKQWLWLWQLYHGNILWQDEERDVLWK